MRATANLPQCVNAHEPVWRSSQLNWGGDAISPRLQRVLQRLNQTTRSRLSGDMLDDIQQAVEQEFQGRKHWIDYRVSIPLLGRRIYVTLLAGPEARSIQRLISEGQWARRKQLLLYGVIAVFIATFSLTALAVFLYLAKAAAGIDLFEGPSLFHPLLAVGA